MATTVKQRHRRLESKRARRRERIATRTPEQMEAREEYKKRLRLRGAMQSIGFYHAMAQHLRARAKTVRVERKMRDEGRPEWPQRPLTTRFLELEPMKNGLERRRQRRVVRHVWKPVDMKALEERGGGIPLTRRRLRKAGARSERGRRAVRSVFHRRGSRSA